MNTIVYVGETPRLFEEEQPGRDTWELLYCTSGEGTVFFDDGQVLHFGKDALVVLPPKGHYRYSDGDTYTGIYLCIEEPSFPEAAAFKTTDDESLLYHAVLSANKVYHSDKVKKELVLSSLGELIVNSLLMLRNDVNYPETVEMIQCMILENYTNPNFSLNEYIHSLSFHYDYLRNLFKKEIGMSPLDFLISLRMKKAKQLLSTLCPNSSIGEIAHMCGYENALYFSRVFRKWYGCSPTQFISRQREKP